MFRHGLLKRLREMAPGFCERLPKDPLIYALQISALCLMKIEQTAL
jgi:hypothetical protein